MVSPFIFSQCGDKSVENGYLKLKFIPTYKGKVVSMYESVNNKDGFPMRFKRLSFFTQVLDGQATLKGSDDIVSMIDFSNLTDKAKAESGVSAEFAMKQGEYSGVNLGIGIPAGINKKVPSDFPSSSPLSEENNYWDSWKSYIFTKTEGALDTLNNGVYNLQFSYHTGIDDLYRTVNLPKNIKIIDGQTTELIIEVDINELLDGKSGAIDPRKNQNAHSLNNKPIALIISNNYQTALKVK